MTEPEIWILQISSFNSPYELVRAWIGKPTLEQLAKYAELGEDDLKQLLQHGSMYKDRGASLYTLELQPKE